MANGWSGWLAAVVLAMSPVWAEPGDTAPAPVVPDVRAVNPGAAAAEAPKPAAKPDKPKPAAEPAKPAPAATGSAETMVATAVVPGAPVPLEAAGRASITCWLISFAMLILGFAAGFVARHVVSRRKLGGMSVRIGTWRGIP